MSDQVTVSNPEEWHVYPAGAHHKVTECSPTLHYMIKTHRKDLYEPEAAPMINEAQAPLSQSPSTPQASHKCAHSMLLAMNDGTDLVIPFSHKMAQRGWKVRKMNGVEVMVIGHGVPRRTIPLSNVKFFDLLTEDDL